MMVSRMQQSLRSPGNDASGSTDWIGRRRPGETLSAVAEAGQGLPVVGGGSHSWSGELLQLRESMMQILKTAAMAMAVVAGACQVTRADEGVWRSSKPLQIRVASTRAQAGSTAAQSVWDRIEYPLLVQRLQIAIHQAQADVEFWQLRLENYEPLRFTDATQTAIKYAENSLHASRRDEADATRKLSLVRRHRVALGELRARMLQRGRVKSQLDR